MSLFEPKKDCFAYEFNPKRGHAQCIALRMLYCKREECNFYKTKEQLESELKKIKERRFLRIR